VRRIKDILGRELKENDLVLGMVISRDSDGLRFGVFNGISVHWGYKDGRLAATSIMHNMYLIENPSEQELKIKQKIIDAVIRIQKEKDESEARRKALKRIPTKELIIGESYEDDKGDKYVYLGKGSVVESYRKTTKEGYIYLWFGYGCKYNKETDEFDSLPSATVLKSPKKLVKLLEEKLTDYVFDKKEFILKGVERRSFWNSWDRYRETLTFKLKE
jgi:hypothetical protein